MNDEERDALLVKLDTNNGWIIKMLGNHLHMHKNLAVAMYSIVGGLVTALIIALVI